MAWGAAVRADARLLANSFRRSLLAANKSPKTIKAYLDGVHLFGNFLAEQECATSVSAISREHVESFLADQLARWRPATAATRHKSLRVFFNWLVEEGEVPASPMRHVKAPHVPEEPPDVLTEEHLRRLLKVCEGKDFAARDTAIIRLLYDTGMHGLKSPPEPRRHRPRSERRYCHGQGTARARLSLWAENGAITRPIPARTGSPPRSAPPEPLGWKVRPDGARGRVSGGAASCKAGGAGPHLYPSVPAYVRPPVARPRWPGRRPNAPSQAGARGQCSLAMAPALRTSGRGRRIGG